MGLSSERDRLVHLREVEIGLSRIDGRRDVYLAHQVVVDLGKEVRGVVRVGVDRIALLDRLEPRNLLPRNGGEDHSVPFARVAQRRPYLHLVVLVLQYGLGVEVGPDGVLQTEAQLPRDRHSIGDEVAIDAVPLPHRDVAHIVPHTQAALSERSQIAQIAEIVGRDHQQPAAVIQEPSEELLLLGKQGVVPRARCVPREQPVVEAVRQAKGAPGVDHNAVQPGRLAGPLEKLVEGEPAIVVNVDDGPWISHDNLHRPCRLYAGTEDVETRQVGAFLAVCVRCVVRIDVL